MKVRRYDIDWIRVLVFDLLIIYHVGMFFVKDWGFHIKNNITLEWLQIPMMFSSLWRLSILFVVSGIGTYYALGNRTRQQYLKERFNRLFIPFFVGIFIIVAPQMYIERLADGSFNGNYIKFYPHFFDGIYPSGNFTWNHLWFLPYLLVMSIIGLPIFLNLKNKASKFKKWIMQCISRYKLALYIFIIPLILVEYLLEPLFPVTRALYNDWYAFAHYFICFVSGFLLVAIGDVFWKQVKAIRYFTLILGAGMFGIFGLFMEYLLKSPFALALKIICMWSIILTIFGFAAKYLNKNSKILAYRNQAVYPFYILHQTITIILGYWLMNNAMHYGWKFLIMVIGTFGISWLLYEYIIRRIKIIRPLFGLKNK